MQKNFSFPCPTDKLTQAKDLLLSIDGVVLKPEIQTQTGVIINGTCTIVVMPALVQALSEQQIAGFDKESMVQFTTESPQKE